MMSKRKQVTVHKDVKQVASSESEVSSQQINIARSDVLGKGRILFLSTNIV